MSLLTWVRKTLLYIYIKLHYTPRNLLIRLVVFLRRRRQPDGARYLTIRGPDGGRLGIWLHAPPATPSSGEGGAEAAAGEAVKPGPKPVHINFHGGGFVFPLHGIDSRFCALMARSLGCWVVDADYRAAPDHPFPAAYNDCVRVLEWVRANEGGLFDTERITMGGFSAGANLALAAAGTAEEPVQGLVAFYPPVDFTVPYAEKAAPPLTKLEGRDKGVVINLREGSLFRSAYLLSLPDPPTREMLTDPRLSPRFAPAEKFPDGGRTMILSAEYDYLDEEARGMAEELEAKGRAVERVWVKGMGHGWDGMCADGTEGARLRDVWWARAVEVVGKAQQARVFSLIDLADDHRLSLRPLNTTTSMSLLTSLQSTLYYLSLRLRVSLHRWWIPLVKLILHFVHPRPSQRITIRGPANQHIRIHVFRPPGYSKPTSSPLPVHLNWHGSSFCLPLHGVGSLFCATLAKKAGCIVLDCSYRVAPEHPFPAAYDDALAAVHWALANTGGEYDTRRLSVGGQSSGGNLALAVTAQLPKGSVCAVLAFYPSTDYTTTYAQKPRPARENLKMEEGTVLPIGQATLFRDSFQRSLPALGITLADPRLSPLFAPLANFPDRGRTMILTCEYDRLDLEGQQMGDKLREAGKDPLVVRVEGVGHAWDAAARGGEMGRKRDEAWERAGEVLKHAWEVVGEEEG
ncbi:alpha/beta-hydrolase [Calocera cornea HHB12733]|uniref:Alpha/beta-hydrolase n=1 Tax=Calocera cornea HHB12733 TaxID=1353952 RepID=A0A165DMK1_9BASI|nr:alpha/beta-hydrolase [Calocera cornea HHB12733]